MVADGDLSDYDATKTTQIQCAIATAASVDCSDVLITITPGSVNIHAQITPSNGDVNAVNTAVSTNLGTTAQANAALAPAGVTVTSTPAIQTTTTDAINQDIANDYTAYYDNAVANWNNAVKKAVGLAIGVLVAIIVAPVALLIAVVILIYCLCCKNKRKVVVKTVA